MAGTAVKRRAVGSPGFTLTEVLTAVVVLGIVAIGAARLYVTTVGVRHKLTSEFDLRQDGLRVLNEIGRGFRWNGTDYGGVHGAREVTLQSSPRRLQFVADGTSVVYAWDEPAQALTRTVGGGTAHVVLDGVERFEAACEQSGRIVIVRLTLVADGNPQPRTELGISLRPRVPDTLCN
jgi:prepilin-type N-terminal cleavage/methylation domain-containing protein